MPRAVPHPPSRSPAAMVAGAGAIALVAWLGYQAWDAARRDPGPTARATRFEVEGLDCPVWCSVRLVDAIERLDGAKVTTIDREHGRVVVRHDPSRQTAADLRLLLTRHGFPVVGSAAVPAGAQ